MELSSIQIRDYSWTLIPYTFSFRIPAGTSRGVMHERKSVFVKAQPLNEIEKTFWGEIAPLPGLSPDLLDNALQPEHLLQKLKNEALYEPESFNGYPAFQFAIESILLQIQSGKPHILFENKFSKGQSSIPINGLVWMGEKDFLIQQIENLIERGFNAIKLKISHQSFEKDVEVLRFIRTGYSSDKIEIRVDANGSFPLEKAETYLHTLAELEVHSIEQPIATRQWKDLQRLCELTPIKIALDEELIGLNHFEILEEVRPQCIILKPSLHGGLCKCLHWLKRAEKSSIQWWITSALESNIGLNAIAQFTAEHSIGQLHGLGTGQLFTQNIPSPLTLESQYMHYQTSKSWDTSLLTS